MEDNIKMDLREIEYDLNWTHLTQNMALRTQYWTYLFFKKQDIF
jgi:hypothetical protein